MQESLADVSIKLNGKSATVPEGSTILDLLKSRDLAERLVVVELNGTIVPRSAFADTRFSSGDQVEIVHFVGGGAGIEG